MGFNRNGTPGEKGGERLKIYTRTGDDGETGLFGAGRVSKDHLRVDAYGQVDELNAAIGLAMALDPRTFCRERSEEHTSELQSQSNLVCRLLLEKKKKNTCKLSSSRSS